MHPSQVPVGFLTACLALAGPALSAAPAVNSPKTPSMTSDRGPAETTDDSLIHLMDRLHDAGMPGGTVRSSSDGDVGFEFLLSPCGQRGGTESTTPSEVLEPFCYSRNRFVEQTLSAKYEALGLFALITSIGVANWDWGSSDFHFNSEGWFSEKNTGSGGMDKLGHAFSTYLMTDLLTYAIRERSSDPRGGEITASLLSFSLMTYVEVFDGFSIDHGFSYEDLIMDALGAGFSVVRNKVPGLREKIDFRMQYLPSPYETFNPFGDYSGQKYLLAVKLAGFDSLRDTPLRYVEFQGGYYARGFSHEERRAGEPRERELYVGIGVNLGELLFGEGPHRDHWASKAARSALGYIQVPYTYLSSDGNSGR